jgi:protein-L-isoaspartate O-methyltransferase
MRRVWRWLLALLLLGCTVVAVSWRALSAVRTVREHSAAAIVATLRVAPSVADTPRFVPFADGTLIPVSSAMTTSRALHLLLAGDLNPTEAAAVKGVLTREPQSVFVQIGCWCGVTALYAARFASQVYAIDADYEAIRMAAANIALSDPSLQQRIELHNVAITASTGVVMLHGVPGSAGTTVAVAYA